MDFYEVILIEKAKRGLSNKDLGTVLDMEGETFRMACKRKSLSNLQIKEIEKYFDSENDNSIVSEDSSKYGKQTKGVPYYDIEFTASFLEVENSQSAHPTSYINHPFFKGCDYVVRASGQSMAKVICHGDAIGLVKLNNWMEFFPFGEIYAIVTYDGHRMVKIITVGQSDDSYTLISKPTDSKKEEFPPQQIKRSSIQSIFKVQASSHLF